MKCSSFCIGKENWQRLIDFGHLFIRRLGCALCLSLFPSQKKSAGYRHGLGLSTVDSVILATVVEENCDELLTTDRHFVVAESQGIVKVSLLA